MDEAEERRIWKRDAAELRRSEVYPALLRLRAALRRQATVYSRDAVDANACAPKMGEISP